MPAAAAAAAAWWAAYGTYVTYAILAYTAYSSYTGARRAKRKARDAYNASQQDRLVMTATAQGARSRLYGEARNVDGVVFKGAHGPHSQYYTLVVALAGHECESIEKIYFNDQELSLTSDGAGGFWVTTAPYGQAIVVSASAAMSVAGGTASVTLPQTPISGSVSISAKTIGDGNRSVAQPPTVVGNLVSCPTGDFTNYVCSYQYDSVSYKARVWKYLGTSTQNIGTDLLESRFPALVNTAGHDDRFAGVCCVVVELQFDQDVFPTGVPNVTGLVRGARCYDPRTGVTAWTQNCAVIARDWSLYGNGGGCTSSELVLPPFIAAANACDISTDFVTPAGTQTRPLYQCDTVLPLDGQPDRHLDEIVESMAGKWGWAGGQLTLVAGVWRAPVLTITEDWVSGAEDIGLVKDQSKADVVNIYRPSISSADVVTDPTTSVTHAYALVSAPEVRSAEYIAADGQELAIEVTLGAVVHNVHAQHVCAVQMRDARFFLSLSLPCKMHAWPLQLFDVVYLTLPYLGFDAETFEVVGWKFSTEKGVILSLKQIDPSIFTPDANFPLPNSTNNTSLVLPWIVPPITGLAVVSGTVALGDGTQQTRAQVSWDAVTNESVLQSGKIEIQYIEATATLPAGDWPSWAEEGGTTSTVIPNLRAGAAYLFRARAVNTLGVRSPWSLMVAHIVAQPPALGGDNLLLNSSFEVDIDVDGLADSWTAYALGTTGTITRTTPAGGLFGSKQQRLASTGLAATSGDRVGITQTVSVAGAAGQQATLSAYLLSGTGTPKAVIQVDWRDGANVSQGISTTGELSPSTSSLGRHFVTDTIPATAVTGIVTIWMSNRTGGTGAAQLDVDAAQLVIGGVLTGYAPNTAEILAGAVATAQLANSAATDVLMDTVASFAPPTPTPTNVLVRSLPAAGWYEIAVSGRYVVTSFTSADRLAVWYAYSGGGVSYGDGNPEYAISFNGQVISFTQTLTINATVPGPWQIAISCGRLNGTSNGTLNNPTMRTTQIKK
jgi:hypothetical protein